MQSQRAHGTDTVKEATEGWGEEGVGRGGLRGEGGFKGGGGCGEGGLRGKGDLRGEEGVCGGGVKGGRGI